MTGTKFFKLIKETISHMNDIATDEVLIVWFCKTLQNWKALAITANKDGMYYELTLNGDKQELYVDTYKKTNNFSIKLEDKDVNS